MKKKTGNYNGIEYTIQVDSGVTERRPFGLTHHEVKTFIYYTVDNIVEVTYNIEQKELIGFLEDIEKTIQKSIDGYLQNSDESSKFESELTQLGYS